MSKSYFITATDTDVGKTVCTAVLGVLAQAAGVDVGFMKPVQCSGNDAEFLKSILQVSDRADMVNPFYATEPLSPHLAFSRAKKRVSQNKILKTFAALQAKHELMLVEGAGGLMVPVSKNYLMADLACDLSLEIIIIARPGLGTINHTLLTIKQARAHGLEIVGVIFCESQKTKKGVCEADNPKTIAKIGGVPVLGVVPFMPTVRRAMKSMKGVAAARNSINKFCSHSVAIDKLLHRDFGAASRMTRYQQQDKDFIWHPFTQMRDWNKEANLVIERAQGSFLYDVAGRRYLDGVSSLWVTVHGHSHPHIKAAVNKQIQRLDHSTLLGLANTPSIELAKRLVAITPAGLDKVFYSDSGSTAVEIAIKMAYQYWQNVGCVQKRHLVHLANSYHGDTLGSVSVGGIDLFHKVYKHLIPKTIQVDFCDGYRAPEGKVYPDYAFECVDKMAALFEQRGSEIAAFVCEPLVQGAAGMMMWPQGVLKRMETICRKHDIIFIVDEVATGFGRTGKMFACEHEDVQPDIMCLAKGMTGGVLPLAATLTSQKIYDGFQFAYQEQKTFFHGHTYTGNPICCAAALANLEIFEQEKTLDHLQKKIQVLKKGLEKFYSLKNVGDVRQKGFMVGIELVADKETKRPFPWQEKMGVRVCQKVRERGVILRPLGDVIVLMPPLSISVEEIEILLDVTHWAIDTVRKEKK